MLTLVENVMLSVLLNARPVRMRGFRLAQTRPILMSSALGAPFLATLRAGARLDVFGGYLLAAASALEQGSLSL